jgi:hypothetical protein
MFDDKKTVEFEGVVKEFQLTNPHSWLLVDVTNKDGSVTTWGIRGRRTEHAHTRRDPAERTAGRHRSPDYGHPMKDGRPAATGWKRRGCRTAKSSILSPDSPCAEGFRRRADRVSWSYRFWRTETVSLPMDESRDFGR